MGRCGGSTHIGRIFGTKQIAPEARPGRPFLTTSSRRSYSTLIHIENMAPILFKLSCAVRPGVPYTAGGKFEDGTEYETIPTQSKGPLFTFMGEDVKRWPDALRCGMRPVFSQRMIENLKSAGVEIASGPVVFRDSPSEGVAFPAYEYPILQQGVEEDLTRKVFPAGFRLIPETWSGADLFTGGRGVLIYCTFKIVELARQHRWRGLTFRVAPGFDLARHEAHYLAPKKEWPPDWLKPYLERENSR